MMRCVTALIALVLFGPGAGSARAQNGVPAQGTEILRGLLKYHGFKPVENLNRDPRSTLFVIVGSERLPFQQNALISQVLTGGGGLLAISDQPLEFRNLLPAVNNLNRASRISGLRIEHADPQKCWNGNPASPLPELPLIDPTLMGLAKRGAPARIWVDQPSTITSLRNPLLSEELMLFPEGSHYAGGDRIRVAEGTPLAVMSNPRLPGLAMAFASRSLFTNEAMVMTDQNGNRSDNFLYTFLVVRLITERLKKNDAPLECVFIEDGRVTTDFDRVGFAERPDMKIPPGIPPVMPPLPVLLDFAFEKGNELVDQAEQRDIPNIFQQKDTRNRFQEGVLTAVAVILSLVLARYLLARGWGTRHAPELAPRVRIDPDRGGFIPERRYALLESGNFYEPMRDHLRTVFQNWNAPDTIREELPPIQTDRPSRPIRRITADLTKLWNVAYSPERLIIAPDNLEEYEEMISELSNAHTNGIWHFGTGGTS